MFSKIFKLSANTILAVLVILGIFVVFSFIPFPGNFKVFTVQSGSMEPAVGTGSLIFVRPAGEYKTGDIITRKTADPKVTVTHRIEEIKEEEGRRYFTTKGDANNAADGEKVFPEDVVGKMVWGLPFVGYPVSYAKTTSGLILLIIIPSVIIIYDELNKIKAEVGKKIKKRKEESGDTEKQII